MHIFLTGAIGIGKSTLRRKLAESVSWSDIGGFLSVQQADVPGAKGSVYLMSPCEEAGPFFPDFRIKIMRPGCPEQFPEIFETRGLELLSGAERKRLILMDELGKTEAAAPEFCRRVSELLDGAVPILGVVRLEGETDLQEYVRNHPKVRLFTVTKENRDLLYDELSFMLKKQLRPSTP